MHYVYSVLTFFFFFVVVAKSELILYWKDYFLELKENAERLINPITFYDFFT